jgi:hypothetical protein
MESDPFGIRMDPNTFVYVLSNPFILIDPYGAESAKGDPYPNCLRTPDGAMCRAGLGGSANGSDGRSPLDSDGVNISLNIQVGRIGPIPVGVSLACTLGPNGLSGIYVGGGFVANTGGAFSSFSPRASFNSQGGDPSGWGVRASGSAAIAAGMGGSASIFATCLSCKGSDGGYAANAGFGPATGPSGSFTAGYRWK